MKSISVFVVAFVLPGAFLQTAMADIVVRYDFSPATQGTNPGNPVPNQIGTGFTATNITITNPGGNTLQSIAAAKTYPSAPVLTTLNWPISPTINTATALTGGYFGFTVNSPANNYHLDSISFDAARGGVSTRGVYVFSSVDNYTTPITVQSLTTTDPTFSSFSVNLGPAFASLSGPVQFRFYGTTEAAGQHLDFDNILVQGAFSTLAPEPGSIVLFAAVGTMFAAFLWRKRAAVRAS